MFSLGSQARIATLAALLVATLVGAQQPTYMTEVGPVPPAVTAAKTIFVSNAGADSGLFPEPFTGDPNRAYSEFYSKLKATGDFQLVDDPSQADLVLEILLTAPAGPTQASKQLGAADPVPMFRLTVYHRPTHYILWTETTSIDLAIRQKTHDRNFDQAMDSLINLFLQVSGKPLTPLPGQPGTKTRFSQRAPNP